ncbi:hypothetical protein PFICI_11999 [Pestalotiopsis fici W106-1]|uniref:Uncharacterized protein n=1 Tax=Pestalotiopsis fici (strain W106-1 / CGMCC3.15140) TaxID=1229662 RepID=W3WTW6_PESFW|nr:uncharacterized protein PFICI_11999 [Pestalotiopsis fici W106-1]ETS76612.1 hypothetical protein PFICI_11999 [Pestalotiopsis fici W106-1]
MASKDDRIRSVFTTSRRHVSEGSNWERFSSIEIWIDPTLTSHIVLYRVVEGPIQDISEHVKVQAGEKAMTHVLTLSNGAVEQIQSLQPGFQITLSDLGAENAKFRGNLGEMEWRGFCCATSTIPFATMTEGERPIADNVKRFLDISPLVGKTDDQGRSTTIDQARDWATDIFHEMIQHSLSDSDRRFFFQNFKVLGGLFRSQHLGDQALPTLLTDSSSALCLSSTVSRNYLTLHRAAVLSMCKALKSSEWLQEKYRSGISDKAEEGLTTLQALASKRREQLQSETEISFHNQYLDAMNISYFAAYLCSNPALVEFLREPDAMFKQVRDVLNSPNYLAHWLPKLIDAGKDKTARTLKMRLSIIHDKLVLLLKMANPLAAPWQNEGAEYKEVNATVNKLVDAAKESGLIDLTNIHLETEILDLRIDGWAMVDTQILSMRKVITSSHMPAQY